MKWGKQHEVLWVCLGRKEKHVRTFVPGQVFMNGRGFFFLSLFCEWKTTGKSSIKANSLPRYDWLLRPKLHLRLLGSWLPGLWLANRGDRDFIHKPVYSSGQRQEIRALEEEIHQSRVSLDRARKARLHITPKSSMLEKWQHSWRSKSPHFGINFIYRQSNRV